MSAFEMNENLLGFEPGAIMMLHGLSKIEMNDQLVEIVQHIITEDKTVRWKCLQLKDNESTTQLISIKQSNLKPLPIADVEVVQRVKRLCDEAQDMAAKARKKAGNAKLLKQAKAKVIECLTLMPNCGLAYNILGDIAHSEQKPQELIVKYMRRSCGNREHTLEEDDRVFRARVGYSGALGNSGDYNGEQYQLYKMLESPCLDNHTNAREAIMMLLGDSLRQQNKYDEAAKLLLDLQKTKSKLGSFMGQNIDQNVQNTLNKISLQYFLMAEKLEKIGDNVVTGSETAETSSSTTKKSRYQEARLWYMKAIRASPEDGATQQAMLRILGKLEAYKEVPKLQVVKNEAGIEAVVALEDGVQIDLAEGTVN